ncbi:acetyl-CoA carboxylase biotin carboxyl carrier protein [Thermoflavimicrobium daqui]|jgi:acetyl-CoA carboxylase biotin carboxyl carrier protein|uniref:Biotin carboxyl carrier protein of acetyl-CoA carboxylase n=1 Tax=Thermoflavimicrobium daqui TaxID=2137476 RepID=A0A364K8E4_9BACL|nr:acetyl-CoA carboxylase biotin carboxyl carrier protein [Thermoflavimicrobium daqui]RAL26563.1 acetyl-CoA carboxylase biotin carboxyl carrier protein [Thermoflavimicrobium daqui]
MAFKMHEIRELIRLMDESKLEEFEWAHGEEKIVIKKVAERAQVVPTPVPQVSSAVPVQTVAPVVTPPAPAVPATPATEPINPPVQEQDLGVADDANLHKIVSPMVGTFYRAPAPDADPYVQEGDTVDEKKVVCIVEAMKLMNEIEAETRGTIVKILVENGQLVEYGQPLFLVKTS